MRLPPRNNVRQIDNVLRKLVNIGGKSYENAVTYNIANGKSSRIIKGTLRSVSPNSLQKTRPKVNRFVLHNHPTKTSLSYSDLRSAINKHKQIYAATPSGSRFRGYVKNDERNILRLHPDLQSTVASQLRKQTKLNETDINFIASHHTNRLLHKKGVVHYRARLSQPDRKLYDTYKNQLNNMQFALKRTPN